MEKILLSPVQRNTVGIKSLHLIHLINITFNRLKHCLTLDVSIILIMFSALSSRQFKLRVKDSKELDGFE